MDSQYLNQKYSFRGWCL